MGGASDRAGVRTGIEVGSLLGEVAHVVPISGDPGRIGIAVSV